MMDEKSSPAESILMLVSKSITTLTNLARNQSMRKILAADTNVWRTSAKLLVSDAMQN